MATNRTSNTAPGMQRAASQMHDTQVRLNTGTGTIRSELETLGMSWRGEASVAFQQAMVPWLENCAKISTQLERMHELMSAHGVRISATEDNVRDAASAMGRRIQL
jgi:WXG100 family type VII secretion target